MLLVDAHLDLSMNALNWDRNLDLDVHAIRDHERDMPGKGRARGTTTLPEMRKGEVGLSVVTVIARTARPESDATGAACQEISYAQAQGQLAYYRVLESQGKIRMVTDAAGLDAQITDWQARPTEAPLGMILSMEGADPIVSPDQVGSWWDDGLRVVGLSHYGVSAYAHGTGTEGGLTDLGRPLLDAMADAGMILDLTHLADQAFWEAVEAFDGPVLASHNNCRALVSGGRQFTDDQLKVIIERGGVIGAALDAWMLYEGWVKERTQPDVVTLEAVADHIDHVCQLAGNAQHAGIGSDLDGGYGTEQTPGDLDTIADLQKVADLLRKRGYAEADIEGIMHANWIRFFGQAWG
ncbi:peptidase M19 [Candidatus Poribacteria bacterium]|jgi:membrane dipeptidase|nr:peptidase M19 [Candidatus Poribacteria bacterium]